MTQLNTSASSVPRSASTISTGRRGGTIFPDQVHNLRQDPVSLRNRRFSRKCLCNKVADIPVNPLPATRAAVPIHSPPSIVGCHITGGCPKNVIQDHREVYDVAHQALDILLADMRVRLRQVKGLVRVYSPRSINIVNPFCGLAPRST